MIPIVSAAAMQEIDRKAQEDYRIPGMLLMEQAGVKGFRITAETFPEKLQKGSRMLFIAGKGNNGGDALVMAREAWTEGWRNISAAVLPGDPCAMVQKHLEICSLMRIPVISWDDLPGEISRCDVVFDGITGTGITGELRSHARDAVFLVNQACAFIVAIDVPSGIFPGCPGNTPVVKAGCTVSMGLPKRACWYPDARGFCGKVLHVNPGFPPSLLEPPGHSAFLVSGIKDCVLPPMAPSVYKNQRGHVLALAGSQGYTGAARLAAHGVLATRSGLVSLLCDHEIYDVLASALWESVIVRPRRDTLEGSWSAWLCGPGWGRDPGRAALLDGLLELGLPGVIDADGIHALAMNPRDLGGQCILTPHPGEFRMLCDSQGDVMEDLASACRKYNAWIVLKSHVTLIGGPEGELLVVDIQNPAMGRAGSGDVLCGLIAGFLSEGLSPGDAALTGVMIHQEAGRQAAETYGWFHGAQLVSCAANAVRDLSPPSLLTSRFSKGK